MSGKDVTVKKSTAISDARPDFLKTDKPAGNENVGAGDVQIPRLKLTQKLSPECDQHSPAYIEGCAPGMIVNTVTQEVVDSLNVVNIFYKREFAVYTKREAGGGGFHGSVDTEAAGWEMVRELGGSPDSHTVRETGKHMVLTLDDEGNPTMEALMLMDGSKIAASNGWNTNIARIKDVDRFATVWNISTVTQSNAKGSWFNYSINFVGYVDESLYKSAKALYEKVAPKVAKAA
ncbi:MAG: hypothetical protein GY880_03090 [Planctomycetaceae bacterium]|jgi:hypothetical protein|nr:hypothetical protein [Planctomycetaceae bacterium]